MLPGSSPYNSQNPPSIFDTKHQGQLKLQPREVMVMPGLVYLPALNSPTALQKAGPPILTGILGNRAA